MSRMWRVGVLWGLGLLVFSVSARAASTDSTTFDDGRAAFSVEFGDEVISRRIMAVVVRPNASHRLSVEGGATTGRWRVQGPMGAVTRVSEGTWQFTAPGQPGLYRVRLRDERTGATIRLRAFVLTPWDPDKKHLHGYRLGRYEQQPRKGLERYEPPAGFIRVTDENKDVRVAPHFRLKQFLCKQTDDLPQYALVRTRLLQRLEGLLAAVNAEGHRVSTLRVMSGYRTPYYNRAIGNTTEYSRHLYGDAADVFVDADGDGRMDDLTGDGRVTEADARALARLVRRAPTPGDDAFDGGLGIYGTAPHRGPFIHVDLRGYRARW